MLRPALSALAIAVAGTSAFYTASVYAQTSTDTKDPSAVSSATYRSPYVRNSHTHGSRGVAFSTNRGTGTAHPQATTHASSAIAQLPMSGHQTSITLFGELDAGVTIEKMKGKDTTVKMSNGNWYWTSWGIKGMEYLGNGNSVIFTLQQAFNLNNGKGEGGGAFNNQAFLGLQGGWGRLTWGHQAGLSSGDGDYSMLGGSALTTAFTPIGNLAGAFILSGWQDNSIAYRTQDINGWQFTGMYSNGSDGDENKWSKNDHYYGVGASYVNGPFNSNLIWEMIDNKGTKSEEMSYQQDLKSTQLVTLGASYDFGSFTLYGAYQYAAHSGMLPNYNIIKTNAVSGASTGAADVSSRKLKSGANQNALSFSIATPLYGGTWMLQANGAKGKIEDSGQKYNVWSVGTAYTYPLSKRTLLYGSINYGQTGKALKKNYKDSGLYGFTTVFGMATSF